jgi:hypothetical protein
VFFCLATDYTLLPSFALTSYGGRAAGQADYTVFLAILLPTDKAIVLLIRTYPKT